jgi:DDE family transposase
VKSDRTACHRFAANQCRFLWHSAAYVFLATLRRDVLRATQWASATMETIQLRILQLGARVQEFQNRLQISFPSSCPVAPVFRRRLTLLACVRVTEQGLGSSVESIEASKATSVWSAQGGSQDVLCLIAAKRPMGTVLRTALWA